MIHFDVFFGRDLGRFPKNVVFKDGVRSGRKIRDPGNFFDADLIPSDRLFFRGPEVRRTLRQRSRYEVSNNSYAKGLVQMLANDTIGTGPRLQMLSVDENFNDEVESAFSKWADAVHLPAKLRTMRMARCQDGEAFAVLATNPKVRHEVKLDLMLVEADRISGDLKWIEDDRSIDGIQFDQW